MASTLIDRKLYNGKYHLIHNPDAKGRAPRYKIVDDKDKLISKPIGVTTVLGKVLAKDFVDWAVNCMAEYLQDKLPVITEEDLKEAKKESARRRDAGASTGSETHALVELYLKGEDISGMTSSASAEASLAFGAFKDWYESQDATVLNVEEVIYSAQYDYAGTYDGMLKIGDRVWLTDLKTTNTSRKAPQGVYAEYFIQLGAYAAAHEEQRQYELEHGGTNLPEIDGLMVISAKKNGQLDIVTNEDVGVRLEDCIRMFHRVVDLMQFLGHVTKELGGK
jgi:hypothetical protein